MKKTLFSCLRIGLVLAFLVGLAASLTQSRAQNPLTNGLIAYWPLDVVQSGILTPDLVNGYDLRPYNASAAVTNFSLGDNYNLVTGVRSNAIMLFGTTNALADRILMSYVAQPGDLLPVNQWSNYTVSFWVKADNSASQPFPTGSRVFSEANTKNPLPFNDIELNQGSVQAIYGMRQQPIVVDGVQYGNFTGGKLQLLTNAPAFDNNWHNVTLVQELTTNLTGPVIDTITTPDTEGNIVLSWPAIRLDSQQANASNQVNSVQQYLVQRADAVNGPWTTLAALDTVGEGKEMRYTNSSATNSLACYRVVQPALRWRVHRLYVDLTNVDYSLPPFPIPNPDTNVNFLSPDGAWYVNNTSFGGILRITGVYFMAGCLDDIAIWNRVLSTNEIGLFMQYGITNLP